MAITQNYVDAAATDDTGAGTSGDPWKTLGKALGATGITQNTTEGNIVWVKAGTYTLTASIDITTDIGLGSRFYPLYIMGYTTTTGDDGKFTLNASTYTIIGGTGSRATTWRNMTYQTGNTGDPCIGTLGQFSGFVNCSFERNADTTGRYLQTGTGNRFVDCYFKDMGSSSHGVYCGGNDCLFLNCSFVTADTYSKSPGTILTLQGNGNVVSNCIVKSSKSAVSSNGISATGYSNTVFNCSIWSNAGTGPRHLFKRHHTGFSK